MNPASRLDGDATLLWCQKWDQLDPWGTLDPWDPLGPRDLTYSFRIGSISVREIFGVIVLCNPGSKWSLVIDLR